MLKAAQTIGGGVSSWDFLQDFPRPETGGLHKSERWEGACMAAVLVVQACVQSLQRVDPLDMLITATLICHHDLTDLHLRCYCLAGA